MLNGTRGNFCLDFTSSRHESEQSIAWSADVGHYLRVATSGCELFRWDRAFPEHLEIEDLQPEALFDLQRRLEEQEPVRELSVVQHAKRVFNIIRSTVGRSEDGFAALRAFLVLLACSVTNSERETVDLGDWSLDERDRSSALEIDDAMWASISGQFINPSTLKDVQLIAELTLRHAAGQLFQEAHYASSIPNPNQLSFGGIAPPPSRRSSREKPVSAGVFFTPPAIVRTLVEISLEALPSNSTQLTIFDPACGSGEFLREAHRQLRARGYQGTIHVIGMDISETAVLMAKLALAPRVVGHDDLLRVTITVGDSLLNAQDGWPTEVDLILMNPPFISWWNLSNEQRDLVRYHLGSIKSKPDISAVFVRRALCALGPRGVFGAVLPTSMLDSTAAAQLRGEILEALSLEFVGRLGNLSMFSSATIDAALVVGSRGAAGPTTMLWSDHRPHSVTAALRAFRARKNAIEIGDGYSIYSAELSDQEDKWSPKPFERQRLLRSRAGLPKAGELFDVRQGVITGANFAFVLTPEEWGDLPIVEQVLFRPAVLNATIRNGQLRQTDYVFYPYDGGRLIVDTESALQAHAPEYYERFLLPNVDRLRSRSLNKGRWWALFRPRAQQDQPKLISTYYGSEGSFAFDERARYVVVQGYSWFPRGANRAKRFNADLGFAYSAILNSGIFFEALSAIARQIGGGQFDLSDRFVSEIPLPDLFEGKLEEVADLALFGRAMSEAKEIDSNALKRVVGSYYS